MRILVKLWRKILYLIITGSISVFIAACYGVRMNYLGSWYIKVKTNDNVPIQGLQVTILEIPENSTQPDTVNEGQTSASGEIYFSLESYDMDAKPRFYAIIEDTDGNENGGSYKDTTIAKPYFRHNDSTTIVLRQVQ